MNLISHNQGITAWSDLNSCFKIRPQKETNKSWIVCSETEEGECDEVSMLNKKKIRLNTCTTSIMNVIVVHSHIGPALEHAHSSTRPRYRVAPQHC